MAYIKVTGNLISLAFHFILMYNDVYNYVACLLCLQLHLVTRQNYFTFGIRVETSCHALFKDQISYHFNKHDCKHYKSLINHILSLTTFIVFIQHRVKVNTQDVAVTFKAISNVCCCLQPEYYLVGLKKNKTVTPALAMQQTTLFNYTEKN